MPQIRNTFCDCTKWGKVANFGEWHSCRGPGMIRYIARVRPRVICLRCWEASVTVFNAPSSDAPEYTWKVKRLVPVRGPKAVYDPYRPGTSHLFTSIKDAKAKADATVSRWCNRATERGQTEFRGTRRRRK